MMKKVVRLVGLIMVFCMMFSTAVIAAEAHEVNYSNMLHELNFDEEYQNENILELYMQAYESLYSDVTYEYKEGMKVNLADYYNARIQLTGSFSDYFTKVEWINRNGEISLSIYPTEKLFGKNYNNPNVLMANVDYAFGLLKNKYSSSSYWNNTDSMYAQFHCHAMFAGENKIPWNIEPWRTESDLSKVIAAKCNP